MDYTKIPVVMICNYLWDLAKGDVAGSTKLPSIVWDVDSFTKQPTAPIAEQNDIPATSTMPYILYDFLYTGVDPTCFPLIREEATLTIIGPIPNIYLVKNFVYDALSKFDISASEINNHIRDTGINFKYVKVRQEQYSLDEKKTVTLSDGTVTRYATTLYVTYEYSRS
jgi:hypothetical protein